MPPSKRKFTLSRSFLKQKGHDCGGPRFSLGAPKLEEPLGILMSTCHSWLCNWIPYKKWIILQCILCFWAHWYENLFCEWNPADLYKILYKIVVLKNTYNSFGHALKKQNDRIEITIQKKKKFGNLWNIKYL
jgi:hypothetical protein